MLKGNQLMKYILFILITSGTCFSQTFEINIQGLRDKDNLEKDYLVINLPNKTAKEFYTNAYKYIQINYKNPDLVIKGNVKDDFISFETYEAKAVEVKIRKWTFRVDIRYTTNLSFKDGRFKYQITDLKMKYSAGKAFIKSNKNSGIYVYDKKDRLRSEDFKIKLEDYFNANVELIKKSLSGKLSKSNDW